MLPSESNSTPPSDKPTGSLEDLFRQKFAEAEIQPRAGLWEQIDHDLVVGQNETYRRRLGTYRWVAAASVLLLLSFGSWFGLRTASQARLSELAAGAASPAAADAAGSAGSAPQTATTQPLSPGRSAAAGYATAGSATGNGSAASRASAAAASQDGTVATAAAQSAAGFVRRLGSLLTANSSGRPEPAVRALAANGSAVTRTGKTGALPGSAADEALSEQSTAAASLGKGVNSLAARMAALAGGRSYGRPVLLPRTAVAVVSSAAQPDEAVSRPRRWRLLGSYAASAYNPNMDFTPPAGTALLVASRSNTPVPVAPPTDTYSLAAAEYRQHLRAGFSQRVALNASYAVNKHWTVQAGLEAAEQHASSRTSYGFLDGKHNDVEASLANPDASVYQRQPLQVRTTAYRYRTAGLPVSVRYASAKPGVSVYAKVGAVVGVLLNTRSELEGSPEATRVYNLNSVDSPYRRVQVAARGGAGARYQPANASWSVAVGPTAEAGLTTLNANPSQQRLQRSRPYAVGLEASVEFGAKPVLAP